MAVAAHSNMFQRLNSELWPSFNALTFILSTVLTSVRCILWMQHVKQALPVKAFVLPPKLLSLLSALVEADNMSDDSELNVAQ